jgi:type IX secretion system PorP/SprF family membrane protein
MRIPQYILIILFVQIQFLSSGQSVSDNSRVTLGYPVYSQYLQNGLIINPAYAGARDALSLMSSYRKQWIGITNAPEVYSLSIHSPLKGDKVALGLYGQYLKFGVTNSYSIYSVYAYHIRFTKGMLSFGLKAGLDISNTDYTNLKLWDQGDEAFQAVDKPYNLFNVGAGIYYSGNRFFGGVSVPSFIFYKNIGNGETQAYHSFSEYNFLVTAGGLVTFTQGFKFKPSLLLDYSLHGTKKINQLDLNGNFIFADILWVGGAWRTTEQVAVGLLQVQTTPQLMFGISYDYPFGRMSSYKVYGSGELFLRYEFGSKVSAANPRYF